jgi:signal transduction histidine kinase
MPPLDAPTRPTGWLRRTWRALTHSLRLRLVALFLLLALAMSAVFFGGMQKALSFGWRDAARPLVADYVDRLAADLGSPPSVERAQALTQRLPLSVRIDGPQVNWESHPQRHRTGPVAHGGRPWGRPDWAERDERDGSRSPEHDLGLLERATADGHRVEFGLSVAAWQNQPRRVGWFTLFALLALTALAYFYVRRLLRPLDDIRQGAQRFGKGEFSQPIRLRRKDELGDLAGDINTMAQDIHRMLEAKRALLLAISHELRSPLTRARLNTELLPDQPDQPELALRREALLRDLALMRDLVTDLLESERLASRHSALHLEPTDMGALAREVLAGQRGTDEVPADATVDGEPRATPDARHTVLLDIDTKLPILQLDASRMRLLLRNLLDNALRHNAGAPAPPELHVRLAQDQSDAATLEIRVRDHGPGVDAAALEHLAEPFYRPDSARQRATGGVGLGLYLCKLVAQAHGGSLALRNAQPGLEATVSIPLPVA